MNFSRALVLSVAAFVAAFVAAPAFAGVPNVMTWAGVLSDGNGSALDGAHAFIFELFDVAGGGASLDTFTENVDVADGDLVVDLAFDPSSFDGSPRFMQITVDGDTLQPRVRLSTQAYAFRAGAIDWEEIEDVPAGFADGIDDSAGAPALAGDGINVSANNTVALADNGVTSAKIADNAIDQSHLTDQCIDTAELASNAVTSEKIQDATISTIDLANSSITTAKIVDGAVATADLANGAVTDSKLADGAVAARHIAGNVQVFLVANTSCASFRGLTTASSCKSSLCNDNGALRFLRCNNNTCDETSARTCNIGAANSNNVTALGVLVP